jgi:hypothetical protein
MNDYFYVSLILKVATEHLLLISPALLLIVGLLLAGSLNDFIFRILRAVKRSIRL